MKSPVMVRAGQKAWATRLANIAKRKAIEVVEQVAIVEVPKPTGKWIDNRPNKRKARQFFLNRIKDINERVPNPTYFGLCGEDLGDFFALKDMVGDLRLKHYSFVFIDKDQAVLDKAKDKLVEYNVPLDNIKFICTKFESLDHHDYERMFDGRGIDICFLDFCGYISGSIIICTSIIAMHMNEKSCFATTFNISGVRIGETSEPKLIANSIDSSRYFGYWKGKDNDKNGHTGNMIIIRKSSLFHTTINCISDAIESVSNSHQRELT